MSMMKPVEVAQEQPSGGGLYWVVVDESAERELALRYAAHKARLNKGHVAIIHMSERQDFQHWGNVEKRVETETRNNAERALWEAANIVYDLHGQISGLYLEEGEHAEQILNLLNDNPASKMFILSCGVHGHGQMISYFTGKGLAQLKVPLVLLPHDLNMNDIDYLGK